MASIPVMYRGTVRFVKLDNEDAACLPAMALRIDTDGRVIFRQRGRDIGLARHILGIKDVLHRMSYKNRDRLDLRRENLVVVQQQRHHHAHRTPICRWCGVEYKPKARDRDQYCCRAHAFADLHISKLCGKIIRAVTRALGITRLCVVCGQDVQLKHGSTIAFCSTACRRAREIQQWRTHAHTRRARKIALFIERVEPHVVLARDRWTCGICGKPIQQGYRYPHPLTPTIDHVIPLCKGGEHSYANCRSAHWTCNSHRKRTTTVKKKVINV